MRLRSFARPTTGRNRIVVRAVDTGMGTVLSVAAPLVEWTRANAPKDGHYRALQPFFLAQLAERARSAGFAGATANRFLLGFALAQLPDTANATGRIPGSLRSMPRGWHDIGRRRHSRTLSGTRQHEQMNKTQVAFAALDEAGEPAAVAGIWYEPHDRNEIGVEVRRESRGLGLAKAVVAAADGPRPRARRRSLVFVPADEYPVPTERAGLRLPSALRHRHRPVPALADRRPRGTDDGIVRQ